jgi:hypothetical protein
MRKVLIPGLLFFLVAACVDGGNLAISAGAPVTAAVQGRLTNCGQPVPNVEVVLDIQQDLDQQARPVDIRIGPHTTSRDGRFLFEVSPLFAVPGPASMQLQVTANGVTETVSGGTLEFRLGTLPRDTTRFDVDLQVELGTC